MTARQEQVEGIFLEVVKGDPAARDEILRARCRDDPTLLAQVRELLRHHAPESEFLDPEDLRAAAGALDEPPLPSGTQVGSYTLRGVLGAGGMGVVYVAEQERPRRTVALKLIRRSAQSHVRRRRFEREAELLGRLQHPGVAQIFEAGVAAVAGTGGTVLQPYLAMELIAGRPLTAHVRNAGLDRRQRLELMVKVCDAVHHAHQRGVIHRDLKPANILVDATGQPKVLDFGVARATGADVESSLHTHHGQLIGTLNYMSPEQVTGNPDDVDTRADVYALGVLLYEVLSGTPPLDLTNLPLPEAARRIQDEQPALLALHDRTLRGDLQTIAAKALAKDKAARYGSASDLGADLESFLAGRPIAAQRVSALELVTRRLRRYRGVLAVAGASLLVLLGVTGYALHESGQNRALAERVQVELSSSNIERGRLSGKSGNVALAEDLLWREWLQRTAPRRTLWALWELYTAHPCRATFKAHAGAFQALAFSPDGRTLATGGNDGKVRLWSVAEADCPVTIAEWPGQASDLLFSGAGTLLAAGPEGSVSLLEPATGKCLRSFAGLTGSVRALALSPDEGALAAGGADGAICVWDFASGEAAVRHEGGHGAVLQVCFSPDGGRLATTHNDGCVQIHQRAGPRFGPGTPVVLSGHRGGARSVAFLADGKTLLTGGLDRTVAFWDIATRLQTRVLETGGGTVRSLNVTRGGRTLLTAGYWSIDTWDLDSGRHLAVFPGPPSTLRLTRDERVLAVAGQNGMCRLWDYAENARFVRLSAEKDPHAGRTVARASRDQALIASGDEHGTVKLWETASGRCLASWQAHRGRIRALRFDPAGQRLATSAMDGIVHLWDLATGERLRSWPESNARTCDALDFSADGRQLAHCATGGGFVIEDVASGAALDRLPFPGTESVGIRFMPDGRSLLALNRAEVARLWTPGAGTVPLPGCDGSVWCCAVHPGGESVAIGTWAEVIEIVDLRTKRFAPRLEGHHGLVVGVEYRPGEPEILASASGDGTVRLWDTEAAVCLATLDAFGERSALSVDFSADGRLLVAAGDDGMVLLWDLAAGMRRVAGNLRYQVERLRPAGAGLPGEARAADVLAAELAPQLLPRFLPRFLPQGAAAPASRPGGIAPAAIALWGARSAQSAR